MLYFLIISLAMTIVEISAISFSLATGLMSLSRSVIMPFFVNAYVLVVLGVVALLMRIFIPRRFWNANKKMFYVSKKEIDFYNKLEIKKWKERVPEMGCSSGFPKNEIKSLEKDYLWRFLQENCYAEFMHYVVAILGFTVVFFLEGFDFIFATPILLANVILNIMPSIIQRYNRVKLKNIYEIVVKREEKLKFTKV